MDKSSDSQSSSWVFVYGNVNSRESTTNTFHLDCSREPIQELTEQDLSLSSSDIESEKSTDTSDGISIISESELPFEDTCATYRDCLKIEDIHDTQLVKNRIACTNRLCIQPTEEHDNEWDWKKLLTPLNLVSAGVVVSAVLVAFYSSLKLPKDVTRNEPVIFDSNGVANSFNEIVDKTISCACGDKRRETFEVESIKQCVYSRLNSYSNFPKYKAHGGEKPAKNVNHNIIQGIFSMNDQTNNNKQNAFEQTDLHKHDKKTYNKKEKQQKYEKNCHEGSISSGAWYSNMHKYRAMLRKNVGKQNKALWYFKRAYARKESRQHENYRAYSD